MDRPVPVLNWLLGCEHHLDRRHEEELDDSVGTHAKGCGLERSKVAEDGGGSGSGSGGVYGTRGGE